MAAARLLSPFGAVSDVAGLAGGGVLGSAQAGPIANVAIRAIATTRSAGQRLAIAKSVQRLNRFYIEFGSGEDAGANGLRSADGVDAGGHCFARRDTGQGGL